MIGATRQRWWPAPFAAMAAAAAVQLAALWPGIVVWDSIRQYGQALSGRYDDWHPPAMSWLWRMLGAAAAGPAPMLLAQWGSYWAGLALLAVAARGRARWGVVVASILPAPYLLVGTILKDSLMAGALLLAAGLIAVRPAGDRWRGAVAAALLVAAATLRFNAVPACLPLALLLVPETWRRGWRWPVAVVACALPLVAALPLANRALGAARSGVELSLVVYDLAGITRYSGVDAFPPLPSDGAGADPVAVASDCYSPVSWDRFAWWGPSPCAIGFAGVRDAFAAQHRSPVSWWLDQIGRHPFAYARHRLGHADAEARLWVRDRDLPGLAMQSDPNDWGFHLSPNRLRDAIGTVAAASLVTPIGWPAVWLALAIGCLIVRPTGGLAPALAWSSVLYALSFAGLGVASEVRYHFWTETAAALAAVMTLLGARGAAGTQVARWRWRVAAALPVGVALVAGAARLSG